MPIFLNKYIMAIKVLDFKYIDIFYFAYSMNEYMPSVYSSVIRLIRNEQVYNKGTKEIKKIHNQVNEHFEISNEHYSFSLEKQQTDKTTLMGEIVYSKDEIPKDVVAKIKGIFMLRSSKPKIQQKDQEEALIKRIFYKQYPQLHQFQKFIEGSVKINWSKYQQSYVGNFQFIFPDALPSSAVIAYEDKIIIVNYFLQIESDQIHYLKEIEYRPINSKPKIEHELSYVVQDFQRRRFCCLNKGNYRIELVLENRTSSQNLQIHGKINYFRKENGSLPSIQSCKIALFCQIYCRSNKSGLNSRHYQYIKMVETQITLNNIPQYGIMVTRFKMSTSDSYPLSSENPFYSIRYFFVVTPLSQEQDIYILEENVRSVDIL